MSQGVGGAPESGESRGLLNAFFSIWTWTELAALVVLCFWIQLALALVTWPFDRQRRITGRTLRLVGGVLPGTACAPTLELQSLRKAAAKTPRTFNCRREQPRVADRPVYYLAASVGDEMAVQSLAVQDPFRAAGACGWRATSPLRRGKPFLGPGCDGDLPAQKPRPGWPS